MKSTKRIGAQERQENASTYVRLVDVLAIQEEAVLLGACRAAHGDLIAVVLADGEKQQVSR